MSCGTARTLPLAFRVPFVLNGGVAAADVELDVVEGRVRLVERDGVQVAACARRAAVLFVEVTAADVAADDKLVVVAGVVRLVV